MIRYICWRMLIGGIVVLGVTLITFLLAHAAAGGFTPGTVLSQNLTADRIAALRHQFGLDRPLWAQYVSWLNNLLHGDLGRSLTTNTPVTSEVFSRLPATMLLTGTALVLAGLMSVPLGIAAARRRGTRADTSIITGSVISASVPNFWLGLLGILIFAVKLRVLPSSGAHSPAGTGLVDSIRHLVLPALVLAVTYMSVWTRFMRSAMIEVLSQDFIRTARARGASERRVVYRHALRNAIIPLITLIGLELPTLLGGAVVVEVVFSWPGIGQLTLNSALEFDYPVVLGVTTLVGILVVVGNLAADVAYSIADPRLRRA